MVYVLVHGGGFGASCWDLLTPHLDGEVVAVDLPGRGRRPAALTQVTIADFVAAVVHEIVDEDLQDVVLVGHSLAGVTLPGVVGAVPERLRHVVFVSAAVPPDRGRVIDTLDPGMREYAEHAGADADASATLDPELAAAVFCNDMDPTLTQYTIDRLVPEAVGVIFEPVSLRGMRAAVPRTYVRLARDAIVEPSRQEQMIANLRAVEGGEPAVPAVATFDIDAGHMVMVSRPEALADFSVPCDAECRFGAAPFVVGAPRTLRGGSMRYLLLICTDESADSAMSPEEGEAQFQEYMKFGEEMGARGVLGGGERLRPSTDATTVRVRDGEVLTSDGPFAETKEQIGGFYAVDCKDLDEAIDVASKIPAARNGSIEVRPIWEM